MNRIIEKMVSFWSGHALVGLVLVFAGLFIAWEGFFKLQELWRQFAPYFPFSLPPDTAQKMQTALPFVFSVFVTTVGSICAVLMGISWALSGLGEMFESKKRVRNPPDFEKPELVAESLRSAQAPYWRSYSRMLRIMGAIWSRARFMSPISYNVMKRIMASCIKVALLGLLFGLVAYGLHMIPSLLKKYVNLEVKLYVPSPAPLYFLLGLVLFFDTIIALTMFPFRRTMFGRTCENVPVLGRGDPRMFFALLEEAAKLLSVKSSQDRRPVRLQNKDRPQIRGTLVENAPEEIRSFAQPAGYLCLPLILLLLGMGFSRLIHFNRPVTPVPYADFLTLYFLDYLMEVFFAIGLIITGLYFVDWARKLFDVRRYRSALLFCYTRPANAQEADPRSKKTMSLEEMAWTTDGGTDERFAQWAREPAGGGSFVTEACWAEILSEAEGAKSPRFLIQMTESQSLDIALARILTLPFCVNFETSAPVCPAPTLKDE
jgi:hypothetical protein